MPLGLPLAPALSRSEPCWVTGQGQSSRQSWSRLMGARGTPIRSLRNVVRGTPGSRAEVGTTICDISAVGVTYRENLLRMQSPRPRHQQS